LAARSATSRTTQTDAVCDTVGRPRQWASVAAMAS
jgi:hypothetical protein